MIQPVQEAQHHSETKSSAELRTPVRNRYFYGKVLDVFHFELETNYFNGKRWLLNRLVTGSGVVCGLDVELQGQAIVVHPGLAIDYCGREVLVTHTSRPVPLPPFPPYSTTTTPENQQRYAGKERHDCCEEDYAHVVLCYRECESDPVPAMVSDCEAPLCLAGSIREQFEVQARPGAAPERKSPPFPDVIEGRRISYDALVDYVTRPCRALPKDCCIPLANIRLRDSGTGWEPEVDIYVRPIVYTNRLLYNLIVSLVNEGDPDQ